MGDGERGGGVGGIDTHRQTNTDFDRNVFNYKVGTYREHYLDDGGEDHSCHSGPLRSQFINCMKIYPYYLFHLHNV